MPSRGLVARLQRVRRLGLAGWRHLAVAAVELLRARLRLAPTPAVRLLDELRRPAAPAAGPAGIAPERVAWAVAGASVRAAASGRRD